MEATSEDARPGTAWAVEIESALQAQRGLVAVSVVIESDHSNSSPCQHCMLVWRDHMAAGSVTPKRRMYPA